MRIFKVYFFQEIGSIIIPSYLKPFGCFLLLISFGWTPLTYSQVTSQPTIGQGRLNSGKHGVFIKSNNLSLADLLQEIHNQSGIEFKVDLEVGNVPFHADVEASSWTEAVLEIIEDFNHILVWDRQKRLTQVHMLSLMDPEVPLEINSEKFPKTPKRGKTTSAQQVPIGEIVLNKAQLSRIGLSPYRSPISPQLLDDHQIRRFLEKHDIRNEEDLKNSKKAMKVRKIARRQLQELRRRSRQNN